MIHSHFEHIMASMRKIAIYIQRKILLLMANCLILILHIKYESIMNITIRMVSMQVALLNSKRGGCSVVGKNRV